MLVELVKSQDYPANKPRNDEINKSGDKKVKNVW